MYCGGKNAGSLKMLQPSEIKGLTVRIGKNRKRDYLIDSPFRRSLADSSLKNNQQRINALIFLVYFLVYQISFFKQYHTQLYFI